MSSVFSGSNFSNCFACRAASLKRGSGNELVGMVKDGTVCANQKVLLYVFALPCPLFSTEKVDGLLVTNSLGKGRGFVV